MLKLFLTSSFQLPEFVKLYIIRNNKVLQSSDRIIQIDMKGSDSHGYG